MLTVWILVFRRTFQAHEIKLDNTKGRCRNAAVFCCSVKTSLFQKSITIPTKIIPALSCQTKHRDAILYLSKLVGIFCSKQHFTKMKWNFAQKIKCSRSAGWCQGRLPAQAPLRWWHGAARPERWGFHQRKNTVHHRSGQRSKCAGNSG